MTDWIAQNGGWIFAFVAALVIGYGAGHKGFRNLWD